MRRSYSLSLSPLPTKLTRSWRSSPASGLCRGCRCHYRAHHDSAHPCCVNCSIPTVPKFRPLDINQFNQFDLYKCVPACLGAGMLLALTSRACGSRRVANLLLLEHLVLECEGFITAGLSAATFLFALQHAVKLNRLTLLRACYLWLKRTGCDVAPGLEIPVTLDAVSGCVVVRTLHAPLVCSHGCGDSRSPWPHPQRGSDYLKLSVFDQLAREEWDAKLQFHEPIVVEESEFIASTSSATTITSSTVAILRTPSGNSGPSSPGTAPAADGRASASVEYSALVFTDSVIGAETAQLDLTSHAADVKVDVTSPLGGVVVLMCAIAGCS